jgi:hypothetical protein
MRSKHSVTGIQIKIGVIFIIIAGLAGVVSECSAKNFGAICEQANIKNT